MVKALRIMRIKEILSERGAVDTKTLSELSGVSSVTIRSDLIHLEQEGFLYRTYGGAVLSHPSDRSSLGAAQPVSADSRLARLSEIGKVVERHTVPSSWILLGYGTTCREVARNLVNQNVKVVTGNIDAVVLMGDSKTAEVFIPGGYLSRHYDYLMLSGEWYQKALSGLNVEQAYISVAGVDAAGFTVGDVLECQTLELVRKIAREVVVVVDSGKFGKTSFFRLSSFDYADTVITNDDVPDEYRELFAKNGVQLLTPSLFAD